MYSRIEVAEAGEFDPREWLRREVLWGSLMAPNSLQLRGWLDESITERAYHQSSLSRQLLYAVQEGTDMQAKAFFNQGKNIAGIILSVALFRAMQDRPAEGASINRLAVQTESVDYCLRMTGGSQAQSRLADNLAVYQECARQVRMAVGSSEDPFAWLSSWDDVEPFARNQRLRRAGQIMGNIASQEISRWLELASQPISEDSPLLVIDNGGHPRSAGDRVNQLTPIFSSIVSSDQYQSYK